MAATTKVQISAKKPGELLVPEACEACFWYRRRDESIEPRSPFPSIFGAIDAISKEAVHAAIDEHQGTPPWLSRLGEVCGYEDPTPTWRTFQVDLGDQVRLTGSPDDILIRPNGQRVIPDYKTARAKGENDPLFAVYQFQLTAYMIMAEMLGLGPVDSIWLVYFEPGSAAVEAAKPENYHAMGFRLPFYAVPYQVEPLNPERFSETLARACEILSADAPPEGRPGCAACQKRLLLAEPLISLAAPA